ncbi:MFS transporter, DHA2 family, methylenomycin A resistance protein [Paraburkholderia phenazinium]|jgi:DHA2 family methylenomycin A resistance protein-like MFS transporter|uniref:MFS transporter, DHA2 family, methylenomycin A resistance protein n=2 Tax=Paraburkholderia phenazinium TaxID=60549 RepID=A0A1G7TKE5_9BURK|nr:MFS transporter, DHA2 family, methylenomycin A resistance protein [Paraburkholderia phenazinium]
MGLMKTTTAPFTPAIARLVATVSVGFVVTQLDVTIVNIALAKIGADLHASVAGLQWIVDAYALAFAVLMLSAGVLGDRLGARRMYAGGIVIFALASLACGLALNGATLVAARALQGIGAAAMLPNSLALLNQACGHDPKLRARAVGLWTAAGAISIAAGPVVGGLLIAAFGWRSIFLVNLPLCAAGLLATFAYVPSPRAAHAESPASPAQPARSIDLPGQCLAIVALTAFTGAVIEWRPLGLTDPLVAGGFGLALIAGIAFVLTEARVAAPMMPLSLFRKRTFSAAVLFGICVNLTYYGMVFVLSLYLQHVRGYTPLQAGLAFLPLTGGFLVSNVLSGWVVGRYGVRVPMICGALTAGIGYGLLHLVGAATPLIGLLLPFLLIPSGMGLAVPAMTTAVLASVERQRGGTASAVLNTARQAGGAVGVAAFGALVSGAGAAHIVFGMQAATAISAGLLLTALVLACLVHPEPHAQQPEEASKRALKPIPATERT